jgi:ZIP family zinc transporter
MINFQPIIFSLIVFLSILLGGFFAIKFKRKLQSIMAFVAGILLGVVGLEILPEIIEEIRINNFGTMGPMVAFVLGFLVFHIIEKTILIHSCHEHGYAEHKHPNVGVFSALALAGHSFVDGMGIGLGFQISPVIGSMVAIAMISHSFTDGLNSATLMLNNKNSERKSKIFLLVHSLAPVLGVILTLFFTLPAYFLTLYLGFFAGFLLYIGASDILPEAHSKNSSYKLIILTVLGVAFIFAISKFV